VLPGWSCRFDVRSGAEELKVKFTEIKLTPADFESRFFTRIKQIKHLLAEGQVDKNLFWKGQI
jgi:hypothetical protein